MRKSFVIIALAAASMNVQAQSSDAAYPLHLWVNEIAGNNERPIYVEISVERVTEADENFSGRKGCGSISVTDNKTEKTVFEGQLNYAGKDLNDEGVGTGIYYFDIRTKNGKTGKIGLRKLSNMDLEITSVTGDISSQPFVKEKFFLAPINGTWIPVGVQSYSESNLLDDLRLALEDYDQDRIEFRTKGFGNVKQFISAHTKLDSSMPIYAKPKGNGAINIRANGNTTAAKVGELKPGETLLVTDEYDGWCQVRLADDKSGYVSLSVVTLTNTAGAKPTAASAEAFILNNDGSLGPLRIGQTMASLPKSVPGLYDSFKYTKELIESDMEDSYTLELCHFYKGGKEIFRAGIEEKKLESFILTKGSEFIKTSEGFHVGYNARQLFQKKPMEWETYYEGEVFGTSGRFTYYFPSDDLQGEVDMPSKVTHIKTNAVLSTIIFR